MLDLQKKEIQIMLDRIHESMQQKLHQMQHRGDDNDDSYKQYNRMFYLLCRNSNLTPYQYAEQMSEYGYEMDGGTIIDIFRKMHIANREKRAELLNWAADTALAFEKATQSGKADDYNNFIKKRKQSVYLPHGDRFRIQDRIGCIMLFAKYPELDQHNDIESLMGFGNVFAKYFFYDISDALMERCGASRPEKESVSRTDTHTLSKNEAIVRFSLEQEKRHNEQLENRLKRVDSMLQDLQDDFNQRIEEAKAQELVSFFAQLNSDRYGHILDELLSVRRGVNALKKSNYELPAEISGLFILTQRLTQFVRENHINPMMPLHDIREVRATDVEGCDYIGTPFTNANEVKKAQVVSPGWIYKDKELIIARPRLKEVVENED